MNQIAIISSILALFIIANRDQQQPTRANAPAYNPFGVPAANPLTESLSQLPVTPDVGNIEFNLAPAPVKEVAQATPKPDQLTTGCVVYVRDDGTCPPCDRLKRDLAERIHCQRGGWKVGWKPTDDFQFAICKTGATPTMIYYRDGEELRRITGYNGTTIAFNAIVDAHPLSKTSQDARKKAATKSTTGPTCKCGDNCPCARTTQVLNPAPVVTYSDPVIYSQPTYSDPVIYSQPVQQQYYHPQPVRRVYRGVVNCVGGVCR